MYFFSQPHVLLMFPFSCALPVESLINPSKGLGILLCEVSLNSLSIRKFLLFLKAPACVIWALCYSDLYLKFLGSCTGYVLGSGQHPPTPKKENTIWGNTILK